MRETAARTDPNNDGIRSRTPVGRVVIKPKIHRVIHPHFGAEGAGVIVRRNLFGAVALALAACGSTTPQSIQADAQLACDGVGIAVANGLRVPARVGALCADVSRITPDDLAAIQAAVASFRPPAKK
jgi:hypothetical protein